MSNTNAAREPERREGPFEAPPKKVVPMNRDAVAVGNMFKTASSQPRSIVGRVVFGLVLAVLAYAVYNGWLS